MYKLKNAVKRAQGTDDAGVNWASVSMELGRCIAHVKKKWRRMKLDNGKAGDGYRQAQFSQLRHCQRSKCPELVGWFNDHLHNPYPGKEEVKCLAARNGLTRNQVVLSTITSKSPREAIAVPNGMPRCRLATVV